MNSRSGGERARQLSGVSASSGREKGNEFVRAFNSSTLVQFGMEHAGAEKAFRELNKTLRAATWKSFQDIAKAYPGARSIKGNRVIFNVKGNSYRVVAAMDYSRQAAFIKFVGTHAEYDAIDADTVSRF